MARGIPHNQVFPVEEADVGGGSDTVGDSRCAHCVGGGGSSGESVEFAGGKMMGGWWKRWVALMYF